MSFLDDLAEAVANFAEGAYSGSGDLLREQWRVLRGREQDDAIGYDEDHNYALRNMVG